MKVLALERNLAMLSMDEMALLMSSDCAAACIGEGETLLWIAMMDSEKRKELAEKWSEINNAWDLADLTGCKMVVWNRTTPVGLGAAKCPYARKGVSLWKCADAENHLYVQRLSEEPRRYFFLQGEPQDDGRVFMYHGVIAMDEYTNEHIRKAMWRYGYGYSSVEELADDEQISLDLAEETAAQSLWEYELNTQDYWKFSDPAYAGAFLRWWVYPVWQEDVELEKPLTHNIFVVRHAGRYYVARDTGRVLAANDSAGYATIEEAEKAWKEGCCGE